MERRAGDCKGGRAGSPRETLRAQCGADERGSATAPCLAYEIIRLWGRVPRSDLGADHSLVRVSKTSGDS